MRILCGLMAAISLFFLAGCSTGAPAQTAPSGVYDDLAEAPLSAMTETREDAEALAQQYEITLVSYDSGIATFSTDEDPRSVIDRGLRNGWQELSLNRNTSIP